MSFFKLLLWPFALLYWLITVFRNLLYDHGFIKTIWFDRPVISVGNITVGGTGKTPFVELLVSLLKPTYKLAILSRGYKRKTTGFRLAGSSDDAGTLGDEPYQYYLKYGQEVAVAVGEERVLAIPEILATHPDVDVILLDDAFQHRRVGRNLNVMLTDFGRMFYEDEILPVGFLRESKKQASRADVIIVTKCPPEMDYEAMLRYDSEIRPYASPNTPVYFTSVRYLPVKRLYGDGNIGRHIYLFTGIANPDLLVQHIKAEYTLIGSRRFTDHHNFSGRELEQMVKEFQALDVPDKVFVTTEKDMSRLHGMKGNILEGFPVFYLPIELYFLANGDSFAEHLESTIRKAISESGEPTK